MTTYMHQPTGVTVERDDDGALSLAAHGCHLKWRINPEDAAAIHAAHLDALGLWLDEETGAVVMSGTTPLGRPGMAILHPGGKLSFDFMDAMWGGVSRDIRDRYLATVTPPPTPQPGERWLLTLDIGGRTAEATVVEHDGETLFVFCDRTTGEYDARPVSKVFEGNRMRVES